MTKSPPQNTGGYESGYASCPCFWGVSPGSLIRDYLQVNASLDGCCALDLGCGEGKNANAFAAAGALVDAVDCSAIALENGQRAFASPNINWIRSDAIDYLKQCRPYDVVILYGLPHCLHSEVEIAELIRLALSKTKNGGMHFTVAFNNGAHDLSAHPGFKPTLLPHTLYCELYEGHDIVSATDKILHETHPHNQIPHFHSITRIVAKVKR